MAGARTTTAVVALGVAVSALLADGVPRPNPWALTHLLFDHHAGVVRRSLVGEGLGRLLGDEVGRAPLEVFSFLVIAVVAGLLAARARSAARRAPVDAVVALAAALVGSVATRTLLLDVGYLDHVGLLLALVATTLPHHPVADAGRLLACLAGVLVHEAFAVTFLPLVALDVLLGDERGGRPAVAVALLLITAGLTAWASDGLRLDPSQGPAFVAHLRARAVGFDVEAPAVGVLTRAASEGPNTMAMFWRDPARWRTLAANGAATLPLGLGAALLAAGAARGRPAVGLVAVACALAPLSLHLVAWDLCRFDALATLGGFVALALVAGRPGPALATPSWLAPVAAGLALLSSALVVADVVPTVP